MNLLSLWISTEYKFGLLAISQLLIKIVHNKTANGLIWRRFTHKNSPVVSQVKPWKYTGNSMAQWIIKIIHMPSSSQCKVRGREQRKGVDKRLIKSQVVSHKTLGIEKKQQKANRIEQKNSIRLYKNLKIYKNIKRKVGKERKFFADNNRGNRTCFKWMWKNSTK